MPPDKIDPQHLKDRTVSQLRTMWIEAVGRGEPPKVKVLLLRELAWYVQQSLRGGMDAQTRALLRSAIRQTRGESVAAGQTESGGHGRLKDPRMAPRGPRPQLQPGSKLVRTWHGAKHEVTVLDGGKRYEYRGEVYRSLTQIARIITGAHWSGPRFFGLHRVEAMR